ncbi:MAG: hypothetical protein ABW221_15270 [Vicinamibacteria bacterium]
MARLLIVLAVVGAAAIWLYLERRARAAGRDRLARARAAFLNAAADESHGDAGGSREAGDRGGLVRVRVPSHWSEQHAPDGSATFSDPASGERILRLSVLSMERRGRARPEDLAFDLASLRPRAESTIETLGDGRLLLKHVDAADEGGRSRVLYTWRLARSLDEDRARLAVFTLTVPSESAHDVLTLDDVRRVERAVRAATVG